jgi:hypothetical protein
MARQLGRQAAETVSLERRLSRTMRCSDHRIMLRWAMPSVRQNIADIGISLIAIRSLLQSESLSWLVESSGLVKYTNKA